jgi:exodeoxyribonuclease V alpha subunit
MTIDGRDAELVLGLGPADVLGQFIRAGVLAAADIHVASALGRLGEDEDELVALAAALAVRAPRVGHVLVDLATVRETAVADLEDETDVAALPWPALDPWLERVGRSPLVGVGDHAPADRPLRLSGSRLYLDRYWRDEDNVALDLMARSRAGPFRVDESSLAEGLARLYPDDSSGLQRQAATTVLRRRLSVIAGGPGTGKTTTVARVLALIAEQAEGGAEPEAAQTEGGDVSRLLPLVALAAPTGKAAARMAEAVHQQAHKLDVDETVRAWLLALDASTVHRLLGRRPGTATRFRHDRNNQLPYDVVVVDETSMMSLPLMARLVEAVRRDARLVLIGDQEQLASVEAGAVLGDIVGPAASTSLSAPERASPSPRRGDGSPGDPSPASTRLASPSLASTSPGNRSPADISQCITVLQSNYRFSGPLAELANEVRSGRADAAIVALTGAPGALDVSSAELASTDQASADQARARQASTVRWLDIDVGTAPSANLEPVRSAALAAARPLAEAARAGDGAAALDALGRFRLLCAHREGPAGASTWNSRVERWLAEAGEGAPPEGGWFVGRPVIVTENDYGLGLFNGDTGVVIASGESGLRVAFRRGSGVITVSPARLGAVETAFAMTVHRAQGSEFNEVVVLLPGAASRILTRELLYTAITRARRSVVLVGREDSLRAAISRPIARATGLTSRLWGQGH